MVELISNFGFLAVIYLVLNIIAFAAYGLDKTKASLNKWRVPEKTLLILAFFGPFGAYAGMLVFRHKTQKKPFTWAVPLFMLIHLILIGIFIFF
ncbi:hypothetical protein MmiAt1_05330 [Methanimicrococcus sp. At1]|uniref:DUF1294 domain-containing protein n=1 Tax=Methanimicrococcus hacksteinii TaxID=3028293 RepID=A0ABU3VP95_9EURY|nr:DUF1294 domain-containing protein [Methanimicrococcus sp. At1]MDV0444981.1 hypothetical protein [Methanimicrococcus sp. At1]